MHHQDDTSASHVVEPRLSEHPLPERQTPLSPQTVAATCSPDPLVADPVAAAVAAALAGLRAGKPPAVRWIARAEPRAAPRVSAPSRRRRGRSRKRRPRTPGPYWRRLRELEARRRYRRPTYSRARASRAPRSRAPRTASAVAPSASSGADPPPGEDPSRGSGCAKIISLAERRGPHCPQHPYCDARGTIAELHRRGLA
jgi:hypothetical protein